MGISLDEFSYRMPLDLDGIPSAKRKKAKEEVRKYIMKQIERDTRSTISPVTGEAYEKLTKAYRERKIKMGAGDKPNLHLHNKMIRSIKDSNTTDGVKFEIRSRKVIPRAYNHNTGDTIPERSFMPDEDLNQDFRPEIVEKVDKILNKYRSLEATKRIEKIRRERDELEQRLFDAIGKQDAQELLLRGFDVEEILADLGE